MIQSILVAVIFILALAYLLWMVRKQFVSKESSCAKGCGCSEIDFKKIEKEMTKGSHKS